MQAQKRFAIPPHCKNECISFAIYIKHESEALMIDDTLSTKFCCPLQFAYLRLKTCPIALRLVPAVSRRYCPSVEGLA